MANHNDNIEVLKEFVQILKTQGFDVLEKMFTPLDPIFATLEMEKKLYESYQKLMDEAHQKNLKEKNITRSVPLCVLACF